MGELCLHRPSRHPTSADRFIKFRFWKSMFKVFHTWSFLSISDLAKKKVYRLKSEKAIYIK